jgi:acetylornithine deacetylase/succinyl-diaminopimelate desuccinylase-like protein
MSTTTEDPTAEATDLLRDMIRNACVNDGRPESGHEVRNVDLRSQYLGNAGFDIERFEPSPGRESLVARIEGTDPDAPSLLLMGHTDVVPVNPDGWSRDPFGAEVVDNFVWGRGAVDMLNLTATQAVAMRRLAASGFTPKGTLIYLAVADEEAQGIWGAKWLLEHERDAVMADYVLTEAGGFRVPAAGGGYRLPVLVEEKGTYWSKLVVRGTPGHGSQPYRTDNALVKAAEIVRRLAEYHSPARIGDTFRQAASAFYPPRLVDKVLDPDQIDPLLAELPVGLGRLLHACTHTTFAPTVAHSGTKTNVIPDYAEVEVDIRTLPGQSAEDVRAMLEDALGDLADEVEVTANADLASASPIDTPLWDVLERVSQRFVPDSGLVPMIMAGATDNRYFRRAGAVGYGYGLFSERLHYEDYGVMFHGNDERVDVESLGLSTQLWEAVAEDLLNS